MSFKLLLLFLILTSCGVKGPPLSKDKSPPSAIEKEFPELNLEPGTISND